MFRYAGSSGTVFHFPVAGIRSGGCIYDPSFPACGLTVTGCGCRYPKHAIVLQIYLLFRKISAFAASKNAVIALRRCGGLFPQKKKGLSAAADRPSG